MQQWLIRRHEAHNLMNFSDYPPLIILILLRYSRTASATYWFHSTVVYHNAKPWTKIECRAIFELVGCGLFDGWGNPISAYSASNICTVAYSELTAVVLELQQAHSVQYLSLMHSTNFSALISSVESNMNKQRRNERISFFDSLWRMFTKPNQPKLLSNHVNANIEVWFVMILDVMK